MTYEENVRIENMIKTAICQHEDKAHYTKAAWDAVVTEGRNHSLLITQTEFNRQLIVERDTYKEALGRIANDADATDLDTCKWIAREVLWEE